MTFSKYQFRVELRQLIEKHIGPSSSFEDYVLITGGAGGGQEQA